VVSGADAERRDYRGKLEMVGWGDLFMTMEGEAEVLKIAKVGFGARVLG